MIIDAYNHIWAAEPEAPEFFLREEHPPEKLVEAMDKGGIEKACVFPLGQNIKNDYIVEAMEKFPERLIGFMEVNPRTDKDAPGKIKYYAEKHGIKGLKLHPLMMGHPVASHEMLDPIFEICGELDVVIYGHCMSDIWNMPMHYEEMARTFPDTKIILGHLGIFWAVDEALMVAGRNDNIWVETSAVPQMHIANAIKTLGAEKVIMGTDWPVMDFDLMREIIKRSTENEKERKLVEGGNIAKMLGLI